MMMQVISKALDSPFGFLDLLQRKVEQLCIVCLKLDRPFLRQDLLIALQELRGGQPSLGMSRFGPRIREVQVDLPNLARYSSVSYFSTARRSTLE